MRESTKSEMKESANGDITWELWGSHDYLKWLNIDPEKTKPVNVLVHPVQYETGVRKENKLQTKIKKAMKDNCSSVEHLEKELSDFLSSQAAEGTPQLIGKDYHWSGYDEFLSCLVMCKKKQTRKVANENKKKQTRTVANEMQLVVRVRTAYLGHGYPKENNG